MDFVILKVNGQDVSNSSHEDAVRCFQLAREPIVVEVLRRQPAQQPAQQQQQRAGSSKEPERNGADAEESRLVSTAVQTDWAGLLEAEEDELLPVDSLGPEDRPSDGFEDFLPPDIDFEEVTLRRTGSAEKLGLTVCYSSGSGSEDADTEVYISEIVPESLAARDGRLREGDQILRVNGRDVANKEQTENLFAETNAAVTILVSRCLCQDEEDEERRGCPRESPTLSPDHPPSYQNSLIEQLIRQQHQRTDERAGEAEESARPPPVPSHTGREKPCGRSAAERRPWTMETVEPAEPVKECASKMDALKLGEAYASRAWSETEHIYETIPESDTEPIYSSPYEHRHWPQPASSPGQPSQSGKWYCSSKSTSSAEEKDNSSSAYNTGESCNSNPLTLELHRAEKDHHGSTLVLCPPRASAAIQPQHHQHQHQHHHQRLGCTCPAFAGRQPRNRADRRGSSSHRSRERGLDSSLPAETMYTNAANLRQTMMLQQQLFKQALDRRNSTIAAPRESTRKSKSPGNFRAPNLTRYQFVGSQQVCSSAPWIPPEDKPSDVQMEWKVKRRADGSRYIARRPVRNRLLRNRAIKISEERAGHSTEDDTVSEIKVGRYWTKEERKRQLERARERKQRQQELQIQMQQQQLQQLQQQQQPQPPQAPEAPTTEHGDEKLAKKPATVVELGQQKKTIRKKSALDEFASVQEMLVHGNRIGGGAAGPGTTGKLMGLLSVTTV